MTTIGANILAPWVDDRAAMFHWLQRARPRMVVVCDEPNVAAQVKSILPAALVIHRWVRVGDGSIANWTPEQWVRDFVLPLPPGVAGYVLNEVGGDWRANAEWMVRVMRLVAPLNIPLVLGNFSKGNPPKAAIYGGELDAFLLAFNDFPLNRIGYHPYFTDDPDTDEHASWHLHFQARARQIGARVRLVATEAGRDRAGAYEDGYRNHFTSPVFAEKLTRQAATLARAGIDMAPFCYGKGAPETVNANASSVGRKRGNRLLEFMDRLFRLVMSLLSRTRPQFAAQGVERFMWEKFDFQNDDVVKDAIVTFNAAPIPEETEDMAPPGWTQVQTGPTGTRIRSAPGLSAPTLTVVKTGDWAARLPGPTVKAGGYTWQPVAVQKDALTHVHGYVALEVIEL